MEGERGPVEQEERGLVERVRDVVGGAAEAWSFLFMLWVGVALVVLGNTLARVIGVGLLAILVSIGIRVLRR